MTSGRSHGTLAANPPTRRHEVAGWTFNRLTKGQQAARHLAADAGEPMPGAGLPENMTLTDMLAIKGAELACPPPRQSDERDRPRPSVPRLVSSNTSHDMQLTRIVELEIIPRLMLMHSTQPPRERAPMPALVLTEEHVHTLARMAAEGDGESTSTYVRALLDNGASQEQVFLDLLAPCARWLGERWEDDTYDFSQVTIGLWRLQRVLHEQSRRSTPIARPDTSIHRALMAAVPGAQHTFGVVMAAEFFGRAGWDVECEAKATWAGLQSQLSRNWFDMFGLSVATGDSIAHVASAILDMREASANPRIFVMVGGPMAAQMPDLAALCGADAMASDAAAAVQAANGVVAQLGTRS